MASSLCNGLLHKLFNEHSPFSLVSSVTVRLILFPCSLFPPLPSCSSIYYQLVVDADAVLVDCGLGSPCSFSFSLLPVLDKHFVLDIWVDLFA